MKCLLKFKSKKELKELKDILNCVLPLAGKLYTRLINKHLDKISCVLKG